MFKILRYILIVVSFSFVFSDEQTVDEVTKVGTAAANWLKLETNPRAIGMGGAFTSVGAGILGVPYNPASIAFVKNQEGFLSKTNYVADITYQVLGYGRNLSGIDFVGIHAFFLDSGDMDVTTAEYPDGTGEKYSVKAMCIRGSFGKRITNRLRVGATAKFIREEIYTTYMQSFALDIGSNFNTGIFGFNLGMSISNLGPEVQFGGDGLEFPCDEPDAPSGSCKKIVDSFVLPLTFRLGLSNEIMGPDSDMIKSRDHKFLISLDAINPIDYTLYGAVGMEYNYSDSFYLRGGTHVGHDTADWSAGAGLKLEVNEYSIGVDYAYVNYGILNYTHQFGLNFEF